MARLVIHLIPHTHWDREWYLPRAAFVARLVPALDDLLTRLETDPDFRSFFLDGQTVLLEDYLRVRPDQRVRVADAGPRRPAARSAPGTSWPTSSFPRARASCGTCSSGAPTPSAWAGGRTCFYSPDAFGHPAIWPALAAEFGMAGGVLWRGLGGEPGQEGDSYRWHAPDGRAILLHHLPARRLRGRVRAGGRSGAARRCMGAAPAGARGPRGDAAPRGDDRGRPSRRAGGDRARARVCSRRSSRRPTCGSRGWTNFSARRPRAGRWRSRAARRAPLVLRLHLDAAGRARHPRAAQAPARGGRAAARARGRAAGRAGRRRGARRPPAAARRYVARAGAVPVPRLDRRLHLGRGRAAGGGPARRRRCRRPARSPARASTP